jgi:uncharacterized repeat protein (TIGR01451 family)
MGISLNIGDFVTKILLSKKVLIQMLSAYLEVLTSVVSKPHARVAVLCAVTLSSLLGTGVWAQAVSPDFDLQLSKHVDNEAPSAPFQTIEFSIEVRNVSGATARDVRVEDRLPVQLTVPEVMAPTTSSGTYDISDGIWRIPEIAPGETALLTVPAYVKTDPQPACVVNRAELISADETNLNNTAVAVIRRPDVERCVDLTPSWSRPLFGDDFCGGEQSVSYQLRVYNRGKQEARDVTLTLAETSDYSLPGLQFTSSNCSGLRCTWESIPANSFRTVVASSKKFRNGKDRLHTIQLVVQSRDEDYAPENDTYSANRTIGSFATPCPTYGVPEPTLPLGGGGGGGGCFIATAAYGSALDDRVQVLRRFRDEWLLPYTFGRRLVRAYYDLSPSIARYIEPRPLARATVRVLLTPVILAITYPIACLLGVLSCTLILVWYTRRHAAQK